MEHLAQLAFEHMMLIQFSDEGDIDPDYSLKLVEALATVLPTFAPEEQDALATIAKRVRDQINAPPDEYGYQPGLLTSVEEREFVDAIISKKAFEEGYFYA
ncbi:MAG: hypothetical protein KF688_12015 [Pirellulales bacterium]|nr:hypothetical protein [Pirellulales bacterium]